MEEPGVISWPSDPSRSDSVLRHVPCYEGCVYQPEPLQRDGASARATASNGRLVIQRNSFLEVIEMEAESSGMKRQMSEPSLSTSSVSNESICRTVPSAATGTAEERPLMKCCQREYTKGFCDRAGCPDLHSLTDIERGKLDRMAADSQHVVWSESVTESSHSVSDNLSDRWGPTPHVQTEGYSRSRKDSELSIAEASDDEQIEGAMVSTASPFSDGKAFLAFLDKSRSKSIDELRSIVPVDENGQQTSVGSVLHAEKRCKPCRNIVGRGGTGCSVGLRCRFCHFPCHSDHPSFKRKPQKEEREFYRAFLAEVISLIAKDPFNFDPDSYPLPPKIENHGDPRVRAKVRRRLAKECADRRERLLQDDLPKREYL